MGTIYLHVWFGKNFSADYTGARERERDQEFKGYTTMMRDDTCFVFGLMWNRES